MFDLARILHLLDYDAWATGRLLEALPDDGPEDAWRLLGHLARSQQVWLARVARQPEEAPPTWGDESAEAVRTRTDRARTAWRTYLGTLSDDQLGTVVTYHNSKGHAYENTLQDILQHIINHGTHHRAQVSTLLRQAGHTPPATDYIVFQRG